MKERVDVMKKPAPGSAAVETVLGTLGLFLIAVLGWAADHVSATANTPTERVMRSFAALSIAAVTAIGSLVDSLYGGGHRLPIIHPRVVGDSSEDSGRLSTHTFATQPADSWTTKR
jgi:hypothetical protein